MDILCNCGNDLNTRYNLTSKKCDECILSNVSVYTFRTGEYPPKEFFGFSDTESLINFWNQYSEEIDILAKIIFRTKKNRKRT